MLKTNRFKVDLNADICTNNARYTFAKVIKNLVETSFVVIKKSPTQFESVISSVHRSEDEN